MDDLQSHLDRVWRTRNAAAETLALVEEQVRQAIRGATVAELAALIELYAPSLSAGPEWTRTFDPLIERLWFWADDETMAGLAAHFAAKGAPWVAVTHALSKENGARVRGSIRQPAWARLPAFGIV